MPPTRIELMQHMPIFGALRSDTLRFLLERARPVEVAQGGYFFREGEASDSMFVLEAGRVAVLKQWRGNLHVLHELGPGDCFGEMSIMDLGPRSASVRAVEPCQAIEFGAGELLQLFERDAEQFALIQMNLGREVCRRLRATDELLFKGWAGETPPDPRGAARR